MDCQSLVSPPRCKTYSFAKLEKASKNQKPLFSTFVRKEECSSFGIPKRASWNSSPSKKNCLTVRFGVAEPSGQPAPMGQKTKYNDNFLDKGILWIFSSKMANVSGKKSVLDGYDGFVDTSRQVMIGRSAEEQRETVKKMLLSLLPRSAPEQFKKLFPPSKFSAEFNAFITVPFFQWLVGPAELKEVEVNGVKQMSGVLIKKCRYLESSGCVGMCVNMCKLPTQDFFTNEFGLPLTMNPNFEDMSCEMIYGQHPPEPSQDPALNQPCYASLCDTAVSEISRCPKLSAIIGSN